MSSSSDNLLQLFFSLQYARFPASEPNYTVDGPKCVYGDNINGGNWYSTSCNEVYEVPCAKLYPSKNEPYTCNIIMMHVTCNPKSHKYLLMFLIS